MDTFDRIEMLLKEKGMTQADLSRASGISTGLISQWKKRMQSPSAEKLKLVADVFGVTVDYLINGDPEKNELPATDRELDDLLNIKKMNPDIRMIARAGKKMTPEQAENLRKYAQYMFPEAFEDDN